MILDDIDTALHELETNRRRARRLRWWHRIGWRQATAQVLFILATVAFVAALLCHSQGDR
ncbi:hypothetical protein [Streptomyces sp. T028]|uniref:hypothetical protein n=1 Tax=Streptomyces sp. T028 TaxID=3394379 RepID=UPI003A8830FD